MACTDLSNLAKVCENLDNEGWQLIKGDIDYHVSIKQTNIPEVHINSVNMYFNTMNGRRPDPKYYHAIDENTFIGEMPYCGHEHDCCGCLCGRSITAFKVPGDDVLWFSKSESFNY